MKRGTTGQAHLAIGAPPEQIYTMVSDVARMGEWSPECVECQWLDGATRPAVGARFRGRNKRGLARWSTTPAVVVATPGREFAFVTRHRGHDMTRWTYEFQPAADGTEVTETFEMLADLPWYLQLVDRLFMGVSDRQADLQDNLTISLARLKTAAEANRP